MYKQTWFLSDLLANKNVSNKLKKITLKKLFIYLLF